jgi:glutamyl-tRNA reductase
MMIILTGLNHKTAPLAVREKLLAACTEKTDLLSELLALPGVREVMHLATCNRVEILAAVKGQDQTTQALRSFVAQSAGITQDEATDCVYTYCDEAAVLHLFRVTSSLDSMIMGETQILGQVKEAYRQALEKHATGALMNRLLHRAFRTAKRVRTETAIAANPVSVSFAAVELAKKIFGNLSGKKVLLIGAGEMAELTGTHLLGNGVQDIIIANRSNAQASILAEKFHGEAVMLADIEEKLAAVDIVVSSTGATKYILSVDAIRQSLTRRKNRPLLLIDIAMPRDIEPAAGELENVYLYNIDNLQDIVDENLQSRKREARLAEAIIEEEVRKYCDWVRELEAVPTIVSLRAMAEAIVQAEIAKAAPWLETMKDEERQKVQALINAVVNKLLHNPVAALKEESADFGSAHITAVTRQLFQLDE